MLYHMMHHGSTVARIDEAVRTEHHGHDLDEATNERKGQNPCPTAIRMFAGYVS
jgi:hypothetical protein